MAFYSWDDLPWSEKRTVTSLARKGFRHPNPRIDKIAKEWAQDTLERNPGVIGWIAGSIVGFLFSTDPGVANSIADRRKAKRILKATNVAP
jgi:hypothetical protein